MDGDESSKGIFLPVLWKLTAIVPLLAIQSSQPKAQATLRLYLHW
jgi:hypothetical protein